MNNKEEVTVSKKTIEEAIKLIEEYAVSIDGEFGDCRTIEKILKEGDKDLLPECYYQLCESVGRKKCTFVYDDYGDEVEVCIYLDHEPTIPEITNIMDDNYQCYSAYIKHYWSE